MPRSPGSPGQGAVCHGPATFIRGGGGRGPIRELTPAQFCPGDILYSRNIKKHTNPPAFYDTGGGGGRFIGYTEQEK